METKSQEDRILVRKRKPLSEATKCKIGIANSLPKVRIICKICHKEFFTYPARRNKAKFCSYRCMGMSQRGKAPWNKGIKGSVKVNKTSFKKGDFLGNKHPNWKGGKYKNPQGYFFIYSPNHPNKNKDGYVMEHRLVMEEIIGRYLKPKEVVHHIDNNPSNNLKTNLMLFKKDIDHRRFHNAEIRRLKNEPRK